jgi:hypothetical protein
MSGSAATRSLRSIVVVTGLALIATPALGQIQYISANRLVSARTDIGGDSRRATNFAPFNAEVSSVNPTNAGCSARQNSTLEPGRMTFISDCSSGGSNAYTADAESTFDVTFELATQTQYRVLGFAGFSFRLSDSAGSIIWQGQPPATDQILQPGRYRLYAGLFTYNMPGPAPGDFQSGNFQFIVPAPASLGLIGIAGLGALRRRRG